MKLEKREAIPSLEIDDPPSFGLGRREQST